MKKFGNSRRDCIEGGSSGAGVLQLKAVTVVVLFLALITTITFSEAATCSGTQYACRNSSICIFGSEVCDGLSDCPFDDDEDLVTCAEYCAETGGYLCRGTSHCLSQELVCDGNDNCLEADDEENCPVVCSDEKFACPSDNHCWPLHYLCDEYQDCVGGEDTDMDFCLSTCREKGWFSCTDGGCFPPHIVCDDESHCLDESDETLCTVNLTNTEGPDGPCHSPGYFECQSDEGVCHYMPWTLCDGGIDDCSGGEDENTTFCRATCEENGWFSCDNFKCIDPLYRCDGKPGECEDNSDEAGCYTTTAEPEGATGSTGQYTSSTMVGSTQPYCQTPGYFECPDGACFYMPWYLCDGTVVCSGSEDENPEFCRATCEENGWFSCDNFKCIDPSYRCDGTPGDCEDNSDEAGCHPTTAADPFDGTTTTGVMGQHTSKLEQTTASPSTFPKTTVFHSTFAKTTYVGKTQPAPTTTADPAPTTTESQPAPTTTAADSGVLSQPSGQLSGGEAAAISVVVILVIMGIPITVALICYKSRRNRPVRYKKRSFNEVSRNSRTTDVETNATKPETNSGYGDLNQVNLVNGGATYTTLVVPPEPVYTEIKEGGENSPIREGDSHAETAPRPPQQPIEPANQFENPVYDTGLGDEQSSEKGSPPPQSVVNPLYGQVTDAGEIPKNISNEDTHL